MGALGGLFVAILCNKKGDHRALSSSARIGCFSALGAKSFMPPLTKTPPNTAMNSPSISPATLIPSIVLDAALEAGQDCSATTRGV